MDAVPKCPLAWTPGPASKGRGEWPASEWPLQSRQKATGTLHMNANTIEMSGSHGCRAEVCSHRLVLHYRTVFIVGPTEQLVRPLERMFGEKPVCRPPL